MYINKMIMNIKFNFVLKVEITTKGTSPSRQWKSRALSQFSFINLFTTITLLILVSSFKRYIQDNRIKANFMPITLSLCCNGNFETSKNFSSINFKHKTNWMHFINNPKTFNKWKTALSYNKTKTDDFLS